MSSSRQPIVDYRRAFADFLDRLGTSDEVAGDWAKYAVAHYADEELEGVHRELVRLMIERDPGGAPV